MEGIILGESEGYNDTATGVEGDGVPALKIGAAVTGRAVVGVEVNAKV
jgi:hypothetical protein